MEQPIPSIINNQYHQRKPYHTYKPYTIHYHQSSIPINHTITHHTRDINTGANAHIRAHPHGQTCVSRSVCNVSKGHITRLTNNRAYAHAEQRGISCERPTHRAGNAHSDWGATAKRNNTGSTTRRHTTRMHTMYS